MENSPQESRNRRSLLVGGVALTIIVLLAGVGIFLNKVNPQAVSSKGLQVVDTIKINPGISIMAYDQTDIQQEVVFNRFVIYKLTESSSPSGQKNPPCLAGVEKNGIQENHECGSVGQQFLALEADYTNEAKTAQNISLRNFTIESSDARALESINESNIVAEPGVPMKIRIIFSEFSVFPTKFVLGYEGTGCVRKVIVAPLAHNAYHIEGCAQEPPSAPTLAPIQNTSLTKTTFKQPYSFTWSEGEITYSLAGVSIGNITSDGTIYDYESDVYVDSASNNYPFNYPAGTALKTIILHVRLDTMAYPECIYNGMKLRRLADEFGTLLQPNSGGLVLSPDGSGCPQPHTTYQDRKVIFVIENLDEKEFTFTTGGQTNKFFTLRKNSDNTFSIVR
ncbi:hypothetical protein KW782_02385 [Candidatus Parcubacteria bacterium]|nr:hypothetical protein [Candidatus Parcubacteria bacterium]